VTIEFRCSCGALCRADEAEVGQLFHCEACGLDLPVPTAEEAARSVQETEAETLSADTETSGPEGAADGDGAPASAAEEPSAAAEALREQLGGGGVADIAAHIHDGEDEAAQAEAAAEAEKHREDADALRQQLGGEEAQAAAEKRRGDADALFEQLGGGGIADIADALRGEGVGGAAGGRAAGGAPAIGAVDLRAAAGPRRTAPKKALRGHERAAHHLSIKKAIWLPSLLVGLFCLAVGVCAVVFRIGPRDIWDIVTGKEDLYAKHLARFHEKLQEAHIPVDGYQIVLHGGEAWAIPKGAEHHKTDTGRVYYANPAGFDEPALLAEDYAKSQAIEQRSQSLLSRYGIALILVGLLLIVLSIFTYRDVRLVRAARAEAGAEPEEAEEAEAVPAEEAGDAESAETTPEAEGETPSDESGPPEAGESDEGEAESPEKTEAGDAEADEDTPATPADAEADDEETPGAASSP